MSALLPWIEQYRIWLVERFAAILKRSVDGAQYRGSVEELDWGPIYFALKSDAAATPIIKLAEHLRSIRNELAHGRPVDWSQIALAMETSSRFDSFVSGNKATDRKA